MQGSFNQTRGLISDQRLPKKNYGIYNSRCSLVVTEPNY